MAHLYETGGMRRVYLRGSENIWKRLLVQAAGFNLALLLRKLVGVGKPRQLRPTLARTFACVLFFIHSVWSILHPRAKIQCPELGLQQPFPERRRYPINSTFVSS